jgi:hypothetical protein
MIEITIVLLVAALSFTIIALITTITDDPGPPPRRK